MAQQIVILLASLFPKEEEIEFFKRNIYTNVSNFASANILSAEPEQYFDILRDIEVEAHKIGNNIPNTNKQFFDTQRTVEVDLSTGQTEKGRLNLPKERLEASAKILANILLDYARNGGNMDDLTPDKVFGRRKP